jgi:DNA-binding protein H-NS
MTLTNYPLNRELVAERQRQRRDADRARRARQGRPPTKARFWTGNWRLPSWLHHPTTRRSGATGPATD